MGMLFAVGEGIMVRVPGHFRSEPPYQVMSAKESDDENVGEHAFTRAGGMTLTLCFPLLGQVGCERAIQTWW